MRLFIKVNGHRETPQAVNTGLTDASSLLTARHARNAKTKSKKFENELMNF